VEQMQPTNEWHCRVDSSFRIFLPHSLRSQVPVSPGDEFIVAVENGVLTFRNYVAAMQRLQDAYTKDIAAEQSLVDELIADREAEAMREDRR
jgi:bifunctional DNA-binding transcriptional regulator/antitoxin component of YhaV-PrlF toxin-antitoxin module